MLSEIRNRLLESSGKTYALITGSGTSAIYLALKAIRFPKDSKVIVPNISCPDPVYAVIWAGYRPLFVDVNIEDYNINLRRLSDAIVNDTKVVAIIAVHLFGNACAITEIQAMAHKHGLFLIEDCAQAYGNEITEGRLGSFGDVSIYSFGKGKIIEVGHGGSIQTDDHALYETMSNEQSRLPTYSRATVEMLGRVHRRLYYAIYGLVSVFPRVNILNLTFVYFFKHYYLYRFSTDFADRILYELARFDVNKESRVRFVQRYLTELKEPTVRMPLLHNKQNILSRLTVRVEDSSNLTKRIRRNGLPSNDMYPMLVSMFRFSYASSDYPNSFRLKGCLLNLWLNDITDGQQTLTIDIINGVGDE